MKKKTNRLYCRIIIGNCICLVKIISRKFVRCSDETFWNSLSREGLAATQCYVVNETTHLLPYSAFTMEVLKFNVKYFVYPRIWRSIKMMDQKTDLCFYIFLVGLIGSMKIPNVCIVHFGKCLINVFVV